MSISLRDILKVRVQTGTVLQQSERQLGISTNQVGERFAEIVRGWHTARVDVRGARGEPGGRGTTGTETTRAVLAPCLPCLCGMSASSARPLVRVPERRWGALRWRGGYVQNCARKHQRE